MNLSENLKKIRKDNDLSQEALAEKLGVSRQSVSKWESGLAYPEMDKVIQICNMFNVNIDELLNQNIKEVEKNKQSKININKYIDDFFAFITKTVKMISSMKFFDIIKLIIEELIIIGILVIAKSIIGSVFGYSFNKILSMFPDKIENVLFDIISSVFEIGMFALIIVILLYIFKIRYLDYYEVDTDEVKDEEKTNDDNIKNDNKSMEIKNNEPKIIVRDPKHSGEGFISFIAKCILFIIKIFVLGFGLFFCFSLVCFSILLVLSFLFIKTGLLFLGGLLGLIGCITINLIILYIILYFVFDRKINFKLVIIPFLTSLIIGGMGIGFIIIGIKDFKVLNEYNEKYMIKEEINVNMEKNLFIDAQTYNNEIEYIQTNDNDIKIVYEHAPITRIYYSNIDTDHGKMLCIKYDFNDNELNEIKYILKNATDKVFVSPDYIKVYVYTNKNNIEKLKSNRKNYFEKERYISTTDRIDSLTKELNDLQGKYYVLEDEKRQSDLEIEKLKEELNNK